MQRLRRVGVPAGVLLGLLLGGDGWAAQPAPAAAPRVSRMHAIGASLLLPGLGQRATGHPHRARAFLAAEAAIVIAFAASEVQGYVGKQSYIEYAERFAGVADASGKPDWYYRNLARYATSDEYVDEIERTARGMFGDDLQAREAYVARNRPVPEDTWVWRSSADRGEYRDRREASRNAYRRASLCLGAAVLNRLVSAVDAARLARHHDDRATLLYRPEFDGLGYVCLQWRID